MTFTHALATNNYGPAKFIVSASAANGTHTTIATALTAASTGDTIFIRPGTYTENLTLKAGVNLCSYICDATTPNVIILGNATASFAGSCTISGVQLKTNGAAFLTVSGSSATVVYGVNCDLNCNDATGISYSSSSSSSQIYFKECTGDQKTTGIALFSMSSAGLLKFNNSEILNTGLTITNSTASAGTIQIRQSRILTPITTSSTNLIRITHSIIDTNDTDVTTLTIAGSGNNFIKESEIIAGTATAITINTNTLRITQSQVGSTNATAAISGTGTLFITDLAFSNTGNNITVTTQNYTYTNIGQYRATGQPAFLAYLGTGDANVSGDGTTYTLGSGNALTEIFDQASNFVTTGTFTAPVTARYELGTYILAQQVVSTMSGSAAIATSNHTYTFGNYATTATGNYPIGISNIADMDVGDTATFQYNFGGGTKVVDVYGSGDQRSICYGWLVA